LKNYETASWWRLTASTECGNALVDACIRAEVRYLGEAVAKDAGKLRLEGKEYLVKEGDLMREEASRIQACTPG
jgi:hypothetical protein